LFRTQPAVVDWRFRPRPAWHMANGMGCGCGGWREQWELRLQPAGDDANLAILSFH